MIEKKITIADIDDESLRSLYQTAFPEEEQIPWRDLMRLVEEMPLDFTAYYEDKQFVGLTIVLPIKSDKRQASPLNWFWYFAVHEDWRGKGYGQQILNQLIKHYDNQTIVLDMESPEQPCENLEQRKRRHAFYIRNGFRDTYVYRTYNDITFTIMIKGEGTFTMQDWDYIVEKLKQFWWPSDIKE